MSSSPFGQRIEVRAREPTVTSVRSLLIIQSLSLENLRDTFFNPRRPSLGLFGSRKIKDVSSLPSRRQCLKSSFQGRDFIQFVLKFFRNRFWILFVIHFQTGFFRF